MQKIILLLLLTLGLSAKIITSNEVYAQSILIQDHVHFLLKHYGIEHNHDGTIQKTVISTKLKPRNTWQKSYEILVKINMLRATHDMSRIEPVGMEPVEELHPDMVYGMTQRVLAELEIFEARKSIKVPNFELHIYKNKTSLDIYNAFSHVSASLNELNRSDFKPEHVFAETMRIYDDLTIVLKYLDIPDNTIPAKRVKDATPTDSLKTSMKVLDRIYKLQRSIGIKKVDFSVFNKTKATPSDVYSVTGMIIAELQTIKAYIGLTTSVTPPALAYTDKIPADVNQLMSWNLRKISLISNLDRR